MELNRRTQTSQREEHTALCQFTRGVRAFLFPIHCKGFSSLTLFSFVENKLPYLG